MSGINKVILVGHVGKDPELRMLNDKIPVVSFPLATPESFTKNGTKAEQTEWHQIVMWHGVAESASKILAKGKLIYVEGKVRTRSSDKAGVKKYTTEVIAEKFTLLGRSTDFEETNP